MGFGLLIRCIDQVSHPVTSPLFGEVRVYHEYLSNCSVNACAISRKSGLNVVQFDTGIPWQKLIKDSVIALSE